MPVIVSFLVFIAIGAGGSMIQCGSPQDGCSDMLAGAGFVAAFFTAILFIAYEFDRGEHR